MLCSLRSSLEVKPRLSVIIVRSSRSLWDYKV
jgi:hypothetical protein